MERFIDIAVEQFARDHTEPETDLYVRLREETYRVMKWPEMQVDAIEGRLSQNAGPADRRPNRSRARNVHRIQHAYDG